MFFFICLYTLYYLCGVRVRNVATAGGTIYTNDNKVVNSFLLALPFYIRVFNTCHLYFLPSTHERRVVTDLY